MSHPSPWRWMTGLLVVVLFATACTAAPTPAPTIEVQAATAVPPTNTTVPSPTSAPTDTPTLAPTNTPTQAPTNTPSPVPSNTPTLAPTNTPPPPPTNTATRLPTRPPAPTVPPTAVPPTAPPAQAANPCNLQPGQSGLIMTNTHPFEVKLTIGGGEWGTHDFMFPGNATTPIQFPPGRYTATLNVIGQGNFRFAADKIDFQADHCYKFVTP